MPENRENREKTPLSPPDTGGDVKGYYCGFVLGFFQEDGRTYFQYIIFSGQAESQDRFEENNQLVFEAQFPDIQFEKIVTPSMLIVPLED